MNPDRLKEYFDKAAIPPPGWRDDLYFYNAARQKIRYGFAPAQTSDKRGAMVLTLGYGEHIDLYHEAIKRYQDMGYDVWAMDWDGQGKSGRANPDAPLKPHADGMRRHVRDLDFFVRNVVQKDRDSPLILTANSMGGHVGLLYLKEHPGVFTAAVLSAPMFDIYRVGLSHPFRPVLKFIFNAACKLGFAEAHAPGGQGMLEKIGRISRRLRGFPEKPENVREAWNRTLREKHPDAALGRPTFAWLVAAYETIEVSMSRAFLKSIRTPVLIASAEYDDLVANDSHKHAAKELPDARHVTIKGAEHGLWFEDDDRYEALWGHISDFLDAKNPPAPGPNVTASANLSFRAFRPDHPRLVREAPLYSHSH